MYHRVNAYVDEYHMLEQSDKVIAGISGGADSICLLFMLLRIQKERGCAVMAVHIHHGLRGQSADADARYVMKVCREHNVELKVYYEDAGRYAREQGLSIEEAGREIRRIRLLQTLEQCGGTKIALAHHQDDNAETLLLNLCRGTGLKGLGGMMPKNGVFIRPLLCLKRQDVESYLEDLGISYCTDETNVEDDYTRNRIRNHVMPYLKEHINAQSVTHMTQTMEQMRLLKQYVEEQTLVWKEKSTHVRTDGSILLMKEEYSQIPEALKGYVLHDVICTMAGKQKDIETVHLKILDQLLRRQVGKEVHMPYQIVVKRSYEGIVFSREGLEQNADKVQIVRKTFDKTVDMTIFPEIPYTKWFDYDIIKNTVKLRHREPGDYICIDKEGKTQKLKQYFINKKIPQEQRDQIWLVADGKQIMWIIGYRQSQEYQVTQYTKKILQIEFNGGEKNGGDC